MFKRASSLPRFSKYAVPSIVFFGYYFAFTGFFAFVPLRLHEIGIRYDLIGTLIAVYPFMLLVVSVPFGIISDRVSPRAAAMAGLLILAASTYSLHLCNGFWSFFAALCALGAGVALYSVNAYSLYFKSLGDTRPGAKIALFNSLGHLGYGLGPMAASMVLGAGGKIDLVFLLAAALFIPCAALMRAAPDTRAMRFHPRDYLDDLRDRRKWFVFAIVFIFTLHFGAESVCYALFLKYYCHVPESRIGIVFLFVGISIVPAAIITGLIADRTRRADVLMTVGIFVSGFFNFTMIFAHSLWPAVLMRIGHAIGDGIFLVYLDVAVTRMFPPKRIGAPLGLRDMLKTAGTLTGALIAGFLPGYAIPFAAAGVIAMLMAPVVYRYFRSA